MGNPTLIEVVRPKANEASLDACLDSVAVARLIEEVRSANFEASRAYNRTYNRHNR